MKCHALVCSIVGAALIYADNKEVNAGFAFKELIAPPTHRIRTHGFYFAGKSACGDHGGAARFEGCNGWNLAGAPCGFGPWVSVLDAGFELGAHSALLGV